LEIHILGWRFDLRPLHWQRKRFNLTSVSSHPPHFSGRLLGLSACSLGLSVMAALAVRELNAGTGGLLLPFYPLFALLLLAGLMLTSLERPRTMCAGFILLTIGASGLLQLTIGADGLLHSAIDGYMPMDMARIYVMVMPASLILGCVVYFFCADGICASLAGMAAPSLGYLFYLAGWSWFEGRSGPVVVGEAFMAIVSAFWVVYMFCRAIQLHSTPDNATAAAVAIYREPLAYSLVPVSKLTAPAE
jgi:hypothetical protein